MPASATYGRLMPRGAGFCYVFCGAFIVRFTALSPSSQIRRQMSGGFDLHRIVHEDHEGGESEPTLLGLPMADGEMSER